MPRRLDRLTVYKASNGQWYWRLKSGNGRIIAVGGEGYTRRRDCARALRRVVEAASRAVLAA